MIESMMDFKDSEEIRAITPKYRDRARNIQKKKGPRDQKMAKRIRKSKANRSFHFFPGDKFSEFFKCVTIEQ